MTTYLTNSGAFLVMALVLWMASGCAENYSSEYKSYGELQSAPASARAWLPEFLPSSATDIREEHNLDTNAIVGEFRFDRRDLDTMLANFVVLPDEDAKKAKGQAKKLAKRVRISKTARAFQWKPDTKGRGVVVVDSQELSAVFWTERP